MKRWGSFLLGLCLAVLLRTASLHTPLQGAVQALSPPEWAAGPVEAETSQPAALTPGVLVVVAAGNEGPAYASIESPGVAPRAFTVGVSDKSDAIADFSSRGPVSDHSVSVTLTISMDNDITPYQDQPPGSYEGRLIAQTTLQGGARAQPPGKPLVVPWKLTIVEPPVQLTKDTKNDGGPSITEAAGGTLWVVWHSDRSGNDDLWYKTSSDRGATWSSAVQFTSDAGSDAWPAITQASDGQLWVVWTSGRSGNSDLWYRTSSNGGATWSADTQLTTDPNADWAPAIFQSADGNLWVAWNSDRSDKYHIWYKTSSDGGLIWSEAAQLSTQPGWNQLPTLAETVDGTVWVVWQREGRLWYRTSSDNGLTWSAEGRLDDPWEAANPAMVKGADGTLWLMWLEQIWMQPTSQLYYSTSDDGGASWSWPQRWTRFRGYDYLPALTVLTDGSVAAVWTSDRWLNEDIWFGILGRHADANPPPQVALFDLRVPYSDQRARVAAYVLDETHVQSASLVWSRDGTPQADLAMSETDLDGVYSVGLGPFPAGTEISYQVRGVDIDGNAVTAPVTPQSFTVLERPTPTPTRTPSPAPPEDTYIYRWTPDSNYCSENQLKVGHRQQYAALLQFDLSHIPPNATVTYARLELWATGWDGTNMDIEVYRILQDTTLCQATWNQAQAGNPWGIAGCNDTSTDRAAEPDACKRTSGVNTQLAFNVTDLMQDWVSGTLANNGVLLRGASELSASLFTFGSVEHSDENVRPRLVAYYEVDGEPTTTPTPTASLTPTPTLTWTVTPTSAATATPTRTATETPQPVWHLFLPAIQLTR
jgi:hypothetical protein